MTLGTDLQSAASGALDAFRRWFRTLADYVRVKHGLGEALYSAAVQDAINKTYGPVVAAVAQLVDACIADGSMRPGLDPGDVLLLMGFLWRVHAGPEGKQQAARIMEYVIEGLRPREAADEKPKESAESPKPQSGRTRRASAQASPSL
jgi:hypothetical protein